MTERTDRRARNLAASEVGVPLGSRVVLRSLHGPGKNGRCRECRDRSWPCPTFHFVFHNRDLTDGCHWCERRFT